VEFRFLLSPVAIEGLAELRKFDETRIRDALVEQLGHEPTKETRHRKRLRPNELAEWELRVGEYRVFYDVDEKESAVKVIAIGYKQRNKVVILGEEYSS